MGKGRPPKRKPIAPKLSELPVHLRELGHLVGTWNVKLRWSEATHRLVGGPIEVDMVIKIQWLDASPWIHYWMGPAHWLIGGDEGRQEFVVLYTDGRPSPRVYRMTFNRGLWKIWRDAPGFRQRFEGRLTKNGRRIEARWDKAEGRKGWARDFDLTFVRAG